VQLRPGDIVIATWAKAGTTWLQQIVLQLLTSGGEDVSALDRVVWVEERWVPRQRMMGALDACIGRRVLKTHLPVDALVFSPVAKYIYIGRDGRDVLWSWHNHHTKLRQVVYDLLNGTPGRKGPPLGKPTEDIRAYFHEWLDKDGFPLWPFWSHVQSWWDIRHLPNVMLTHFSRLKGDMRGAILCFAGFLGINVDPEALPRILEHCSFEYMQSHASALSRWFETSLVGGGKTFVHRGTNGRWANVLTTSDVAKYENAASTHLTPDCARWLATGLMDDSAPVSRGRVQAM
jgi:aryl sulfotransferase